MSRNKEFKRLTELSGAELLTELKDARHELFNLKFQWMVTKQLANSSRLGALRHKIAQILTVVRKRQLTEEVSQHA